MATNGIDFVIGGKDQAGSAMGKVEKSLQRLEEKTESLSNSTNALAMVTVALAAAYGALKAGMALLGGIEAVNEAYDKQTEAVRGLNNALALQGANVDAESARLQQFASDMQALTGVGDEVTLGLIRQAQQMGTTTDQLDDMARAGIGLGEAFGTSAEGGMAMMRQAQQRNFSAFEAMFPQMRYMQSLDEKLAFASQLAARGLEQKAEGAGSAAGMAARASGAIGDLMEKVGAIMAPIRILISAGLQTLAESLQTVIVPAVTMAEDALDNIGPLMDWVRQKVVEAVNLMVKAFTFLEVIITNLDVVWEMVTTNAALWMERISGVVEHALTVQIPAYASWFGENFVNLIRDALNLAFTVVVNHIAKIVDAFEALWNFVATMGESDIARDLGNIAGRSWLEGFESSLTSLPEVAVRKLSEREKDLADKMRGLGGRLGDEFANKIKDRMIEVTKMAEEKQKELAGSPNLRFDPRIFKMEAVNVTQGRLLTRGPGLSIPNKMDEIIRLLKNPPKPRDKGLPQVSLDPAAMESLMGIEKNTSVAIQMEAVV